MIEQLLKRHLEGFEAEKILDVGPGYNNFSRIAAQITGAMSVTYIDNNADVLRWQSDACRQASLQCDSLLLSLDNVFDLTHLEHSYDLILCQEILEHLRDPKSLLTTLTKLLSYNGRIVITVPTKTSERWMHFLNPSYMNDQQGGHIQEFDEQRIMELLHASCLIPEAFIPTQPHYFISHSWLFASRMQVEAATGHVKTRGIRHFIWTKVHSSSKFLFERTGIDYWGKVFPRNYFIIASRSLRITISDK